MADDIEILPTLVPVPSPGRDDETSLHNVKKQEPIWSNELTDGEAVIWGDQITNTVRKLKSLTFFSVGTTPIPAAEVAAEARAEGEGSEAPGGGGQEEKPKRKGRVGNSANPRRGGRRVKKIPVPSIQSVIIEGGEESMGFEETPIEHSGPVDFVVDEFGLDNVASFECVQTDDVEIKVETEEEQKKRKRQPNVANGEKPNSTYTDIITKALEENPEGLTVSEIYDYISREYPYYQPNDDRWKNSVRHNLSISPYFHKGEKSKFGAGHIWTIAEDCRDIRPRRRYAGITRSTMMDASCSTGDNGMDSEVSKFKSETDYAVANILDDYTRACSKNGVQESHEIERQSEATVQFSDQCTQVIDQVAPMSQEEAEIDEAAREVALACHQIEIEMEQMHRFHTIDASAITTNQILSLTAGDDTMSLIPRGNEVLEIEMSDLHIDTSEMVINLESYFQPADLLFLNNEHVEGCEQ